MSNPWIVERTDAGISERELTDEELALLADRSPWEVFPNLVEFWPLYTAKTVNSAP